jgi:cobalamin biosynthesis Mg chelatase CobN
MLKKFVSLSLIYAILVLSFFSTQSPAQAQSNALKADALKLGELKTEQALPPQTEVKKVFSKELQKSKSETSVSEIDFKKLERIEMKSAAKAKLSKKDKAWIVVAVVALVVGVVLLAIYAKIPKCSEVSCNPDYDENCYCDED